MTSGKRTPSQEEAERQKSLRVQRELAAFGTTERRPPEMRDNREAWWSDRFDWLKDRGYLLRARYSPTWVPSWKNSTKVWFEHEDSRNLDVYPVFDDMILGFR